MSGQRSSAPPNRTVLEPLFAVHRGLHPKADLKLVQRAYEVAEKAHDGQFRKSGDPYITHPLAVATILADLGMDTTTLVAALLHDTVEDTDYTLQNASADFGDEVAHLVNGVTKLDKVHFGAATEAETIRKMIIAMAQDPRVLVIKLADRLHNMRTMRFLPPDKQARKARETLEVLAPLAHRLGMATVKWELEDLAFSILHSKRYDEIVRLVADRAPSGIPTSPRSPGSSRPNCRPPRFLARWSAVASTITRSIRRCRRAAASSTRSTTWWRCAFWSAACASVTPPWVWCMRCGRRCQAGSRTTSRSRDTASISLCTQR